MSMNRTIRTAGVVVGGVLVAGAALLGSAAPAVAAPGVADPAPTAPSEPGAPDAGDLEGARPLGIPVIGLVNAVLKGASSIVPSTQVSGQ